jgi:gamma-glutamyl-gamma-aminobutyrate hydrolase PuuD
MLFFLPNYLNVDFDYIADDLDCLILTGGDDSTLRRTVETKLATKVMQRNKPVIGICHGAFMLTDLLGGVVEPILGHKDTTHKINYFGDLISVNSYHDSAITKLHKTGTQLCSDDNGHTEAFIDGKLAGVVWHPERMEVPWLPDEIEDLLRG